MKIYDIKLSYNCVGEAEPKTCATPLDAVKVLAGAFDANPQQEQLWVISLNRKHRVIGRNLATLGTATSSLAHPRETFRAAILANASAIVLAHNHPSGDPSPSSADSAITKQIREAGDIIGIELLDHVIIGNPTDDPKMLGYFSFRDNGLIS